MGLWNPPLGCKRIRSESNKPRSISCVFKSDVNGRKRNRTWQPHLFKFKIANIGHWSVPLQRVRIDWTVFSAMWNWKDYSLVRSFCLTFISPDKYWRYWGQFHKGKNLGTAPFCTLCSSLRIFWGIKYGAECKMDHPQLLILTKSTFFPCPIILSSLPLRGFTVSQFPSRLGLYAIITVTQP